MKLHPSRSRSGVALIIVLIAMVSLSILAGIFAFRMKVEARLAMNSNNDAEMEWLGRSGAEAAKWLLGQEMQAGCPDMRESSVWAGGSGGTCPGLSNSPIAGIHLPWTIELGNGQVTVQPMVDLESKANINTANEQMLEQALVLMGVDAGEYPVIVNSILDWIDPDDAERPQGAESDFYESLDRPYEAKNTPIDDISELILVQGIAPEIYDPKTYGAIQSRAQRDPRHRLGFDADAPVYNVGLVDLFTPISSGRININTAPIEVLQLLPGVDEHAASEIIRLRNGFDAGFGVTEPVPFHNPGEIINAGLNPAVVQRIIPLCDVRSATFQVRLTATIGNYSRDFQAIIVRNNPRDVQVVSFHAVEKQ